MHGIDEDNTHAQTPEEAVPSQSAMPETETQTPVTARRRHLSHPQPTLTHSPSQRQHVAYQPRWLSDDAESVTPRHGHAHTSIASPSKLRRHHPHQTSQIITQAPANMGIPQSAMRIQQPTTAGHKIRLLSQQVQNISMHITSYHDNIIVCNLIMFRMIHRTYRFHLLTFAEPTLSIVLFVLPLFDSVVVC
jgi:hypothetical protein